MTPLRSSGTKRLRLAALAVAALMAMLAGAPPAAAQNPGTPGRFDYYLLTLSWSPAYCAAHGDSPSAGYQCRSGRALGFVEHGLWPQFEDGSWPYFCGTAHRIPHVLVEPVLAAIPSEALIQHEWQAHGSCTGLAVEAYLGLVTRAFAAVHAPQAAAGWLHGAALPLAELKRQILAANPGLSPAMLAVHCGHEAKDRLEEIRYCLDKSLGFRACGQRVRDDCAGRVTLDPAPAATSGPGNNTKHP